MKIRTNVKAGGLDTFNHNEKLASDKKTKSLTVKTGIKAGVGYLKEPGKIEFPN
jgi:hypothetical protein